MRNHNYMEVNIKIHDNVESDIHTENSLQIDWLNHKNCSMNAMHLSQAE